MIKSKQISTVFVFTALLSFLIASPSMSGEILIQAINKAHTDFKKFRITVERSDKVSQAEFRRIENYIREKGFVPQWSQDAVAEADYYFACPHKSGSWTPCERYDREDYISCVAEFQKSSVSGRATYESKETCYNSSRYRGLLNFFE